MGSKEIMLIIRWKRPATRPAKSRRYFKGVLFFSMTLFLLLQATLVFPMWKFPYWRLQSFFGEVFNGRFWPLIPYWLYDQPIPIEGDTKIKFQLWIKPIFFKARLVKAEELGNRINRFQFDAMLKVLVTHKLDGKQTIALKGYLERQTGFEIVACWLQAKTLLYDQKSWRTQSSEAKIILW